jgi:8-oxo-dGTP pyrophosphatase MutT (NUDIX family)
LREVTEETGFTCDLGGLVAVLEFQGDDDSVLHRFHIFEMRPVSGAFVPNPETDAIAWLTPSDAIARASYDNVRALLALAPERFHSISTTGRLQR